MELRGLATGEAARPRSLGVLTCCYLAAVVCALVMHGPHPLSWLAQFAWTNVDKIVLPDGSLSRPALGNHHFGDWQMYLGWAHDPNPYLLDGGLPALPPTLFAVRLLDGLSPLSSWLIVAALSAALTLAATFVHMSNRPVRQRLLTWLLLFGLSAGLVSSLDRGSLTAMAGGLVGLWVWAYQRNRWYLAALFLAFAIVLKPYLVLLLLWPILRNHWRTVTATGVIVAVTSLIGFAVLPGGLFASVRGYLDSSGGYTTLWADFAFFWSHGMLALLVDPVLTLTGDAGLTLTWIHALPTVVILAPGFAWLALVAWITWTRRVSEPLIACLVLSLGQLVLPSSGGYTAVFASVGALILLVSPVGPPAELAARRAIQVALLVTIVPIPLSFGGYVHLNGQIYSPVHVGALLSAVAWLTAGVTCAQVRSKSAKQPVQIPFERVDLEDEAVA